MFNFKEIFALLHSRHACEQVKNGKELTDMVLRLCKDKDLSTEMVKTVLILFVKIAVLHNVIHKMYVSYLKNTILFHKLDIIY